MLLPGQSQHRQPADQESMSGTALGGALRPAVD